MIDAEYSLRDWIIKDKLNLDNIAKNANKINGYYASNNPNVHLFIELFENRIHWPTI